MYKSNYQLRRELEEALQDLQSTANYFSLNCIKDSKVRFQYYKDIRGIPTEINTMVQEGQLTLSEAAELASRMRNQILELSRKQSSQVGRAYAMKMKKQGKNIGELREKYATKDFGKNFSELNELEETSVYKTIIKASGHANDDVMIMAQRMGKIGRRILFVSLAISVYEVLESDNKPKEIAHQGVVTSAGVLGGLGAGAAAVGMGVCAATAPICVGIISFIGAFVASYGADSIFDSIYHGVGQ